MLYEKHSRILGFRAVEDWWQVVIYIARPDEDGVLRWQVYEVVGPNHSREPSYPDTKQGREWLEDTARRFGIPADTHVREGDTMVEADRRRTISIIANWGVQP